MGLTSSYNSDRWRLAIHIDGKTYVYKDVSPFHHAQFEKKRKNVGKAMAYIRGFGLLDRCPVCSKTYLDQDDICTICGWQNDVMAKTPDKCSAGPNYAPLNVIKERWAEGERDHEKLGACPNQRVEIGCFECPYDANPEEEEGEEQKTG
jgi:hypothetical protein